MKPATVLALALFSFPLSLTAQFQSQSQPHGWGVAGMEGIGQNSVLDSRAVLPSCPISMRVRQGIGNGVLVVKGGKRLDTVGSRLRLNLAPSQDRPGTVIAATVIVHGFNGKPGVFPLVATRDHASEITKTLAVSLTADDDNSFWSELLLPGLTGPNRVDLQSVTYVDGSIWKVALTDACHVAPDPFMLVAAQ